MPLSKPQRAVNLNQAFFVGSACSHPVTRGKREYMYSNGNSQPATGLKHGRMAGWMEHRTDGDAAGLDKVDCVLLPAGTEPGHPW